MWPLTDIWEKIADYYCDLQYYVPYYKIWDEDRYEVYHAKAEYKTSKSLCL